MKGRFYYFELRFKNLSMVSDDQVYNNISYKWNNVTLQKVYLLDISLNISFLLLFHFPLKILLAPFQFYENDSAILLL